jgi:hypothetical protein
MAIILKANKVNLFVSSVLFVFWNHSPNVLDTLHICNISWLRVNGFYLVLSTAFFLVNTPGGKEEAAVRSGVNGNWNLYILNIS